MMMLGEAQGLQAGITAVSKMRRGYEESVQMNFRLAVYGKRGHQIKMGENSILVCPSGKAFNTKSPCGEQEKTCDIMRVCCNKRRNPRSYVGFIHCKRLSR